MDNYALAVLNVCAGLAFLWYVSLGQLEIVKYAFYYIVAVMETAMLANLVFGKQVAAACSILFVVVSVAYTCTVQGLVECITVLELCTYSSMPNDLATRFVYTSLVFNSTILVRFTFA